MKLYMAIVYLRRLRKTGMLGEEKKNYEQFGTEQDFAKLFGNEIKD